MANEDDETKDEANARMGREHLGAGIGLGAISLGAAAIGAVCPMCVVAVPALIGSGIYHRLKARRARDEAAAPELVPGGATE